MHTHIPSQCTMHRWQAQNDLTHCHSYRTVSQSLALFSCTHTQAHTYNVYERDTVLPLIVLIGGVSLVSEKCSYLESKRRGRGIFIAATVVTVVGVTRCLHWRDRDSFHLCSIIFLFWFSNSTTRPNTKSTNAICNKKIYILKRGIRKKLDVAFTRHKYLFHILFYFVLALRRSGTWTGYFEKSNEISSCGLRNDLKPPEVSSTITRMQAAAASHASDATPAGMQATHSYTQTEFAWCDVHELQ